MTQSQKAYVKKQDKLKRMFQRRQKVLFAFGVNIPELLNNDNFLLTLTTLAHNSLLLSYSVCS